MHTYGATRCVSCRSESSNDGATTEEKGEYTPADRPSSKSGTVRRHRLSRYRRHDCVWTNIVIILSYSKLSMLLSDFAGGSGRAKSHRTSFRGLLHFYRFSEICVDPRPTNVPNTRVAIVQIHF